MDKITAIITAAGSGKRMGTDQKKQYLKLQNKPILYYTLKNFSECPAIDEIVLVLPQEDIEYVKNEIIAKYKITKITTYVAGGKERQDSINNALNVLPCDKGDIVVIHDGVRPFITDEIITESIEAARKHGGAVAGVMVKDTIKELDSGVYSKTLQRDRLVAVQTPQTFQAGLIKEAYRNADKEGFYSTDDAALVEKYSATAVVFIEGSYFNIKITTPEDIIFAEAILAKNRKKEKTVSR